MIALAQVARTAEVGDSFKQALEFCSFPIEEGRRTGESIPSHLRQKKLKKDVDTTEKEVRINSAIVTMTDGNVSVKRGVTLPVSSQ